NQLIDARQVAGSSSSNPLIVKVKIWSALQTCQFSMHLICRFIEGRPNGMQGGDITVQPLFKTQEFGEVRLTLESRTASGFKCTAHLLDDFLFVGFMAVSL